MLLENEYPSLSELMIAGTELPEKIFTRSFEQYLFSNVDLGSSRPMIEAVRAIVSCCDYLDADVHVFVSWDRSYLAHLDIQMDWHDEMSRHRKVVQDNVGYSGLTLLDSKHRWIFYQYYPLEIGVFAINSQLEFGLIEGVKDCFFSCNDLARWSRRETQQDIDLVDDNFGLYVLTALIKNYC
jgi:hypothetical protein